MTDESRVHLRWPAVIVAAVVLLGIGAGTVYLIMRTPEAIAEGPVAPPPAPEPGTSPRAPAATGTAPLPDVVVKLGAGAVERAGITLAPITPGSVSGTLRAPGVVEPNAYKQVAVTPLVSGRVTRVTAELGARVTRGQSMAQIFSPELTEAHARYIAARAELEAHEKELLRTEKLVAIGAASRQELERVHAEHTAHRAGVQSAAARLELLGVPAAAIEAMESGQAGAATTNVPAPITGVVTERQANPGLNVDQTTPLFTVADLSTVWVVAEVYEKDFGRVRVGNRVTITTTAYPDRTMEGRVSYIDPRVNPETRTAKVRIEVSNPRQELRLGMFAEAVFAGAGDSTTVTIPRAAVQNVGERTVVYLADRQEGGTFIEREVRLGAATGDRVAVLAGIQEGDVVAATGSFYIRAERERLGLRGAPASPSGHGSMPGHTPPVQEAAVSVTDAAFEPSRVTLAAGVPARLTFTRKSDKTCATEVVLASLNIRRELPLNQPVTIEFTPDKAGELTFVCGMNMVRGTVVVR